MSHQVVWTRRVVTLFEDAANLTDLERQVLETRVAGMTRVQQSFYLNLSVSTIDKVISRLKQKYDVVQKEYPDDLKPRKFSAAETYMDDN